MKVNETRIGTRDESEGFEERSETGQRSLRNLLIEGLVIVASILLAFAIDAGWDQVREREQEQRLLVQLIGELDLYIDRLGPAAQRRTDTVEADSQWLLQAIHGAEEHADDEWLKAVASLPGAFEFSAATPVFNILTADGGLQLVSDPKIRDELSNVSSWLGVARRFEELQGDFIANELNPWMSRNIDRYASRRLRDPNGAEGPGSRFDPGVASLRTRDFSNLLVERQNRLNLVKMFRYRTLERMGVLREMVQAELAE